jgi:hypothetical protein
MKNIEIINEPIYTFGSSDNPRGYSFELDLSGEYRPSSVHGVVIDGIPVAVFGSCGGATGAHSRSLFEFAGHSYLAVGPYIVCFSRGPFQYHWALQVDPATCFGVYYHDATGALLSHGELEISRFNASGQIIWSTSGADIFTEGFTLHPQFAEAIDFNGKVYRFDYLDGHEHA